MRARQEPILEVHQMMSSFHIFDNIIEGELGIASFLVNYF